MLELLSLRPAELSGWPLKRGERGAIGERGNYSMLGEDRKKMALYIHLLPTSFSSSLFLSSRHQSGKKGPWEAKFVVVVVPIFRCHARQAFVIMVFKELFFPTLLCFFFPGHPLMLFDAQEERLLLPVCSSWSRSRWKQSNRREREREEER